MVKVDSLFGSALRLRKPGLFVTATDTGVGKTVITCAMAWNLRRRGLKVSVSKPMASGCRRQREGLISEDAEGLAYFSDSRQPLDVINPIRFAAPVAPAVAAEEARQGVDYSELARSLEVLDEAGDCLLVEGVGGLLVPIDPGEPRRTVLDLAMALDYPVVVVARAALGTLSHTAMTVRLLKEAGCRVAGIVINGYEPDVGKASDPSMASNRVWLEKMNRVPILAVVPACAAAEVAPHEAKIPGAILEAVGMTDWREVMRGRRD